MTTLCKCIEREMKRSSHAVHKHAHARMLVRFEGNKIESVDAKKQRKQCSDKSCFQCVQKQSTGRGHVDRAPGILKVRGVLNENGFGPVRLW